MSYKAKSPLQIDDKYLKDIHLNGLDGRLLHLPSQKNKKFILLSGQHAAHERMYAMAQLINEFGEVYLPDLPGYGGMDSFYKIGKRPTWDNYADYLYTFLKSQKLNKNLWFFANSFGAQVMTRMLQKYPDSRKWVGSAIGFVAFGSGDNFNVSKKYRFYIYPLIYIASTKIGSKLISSLAFNRVSLRVMLFFFSRTKAKMQNDDENLKKDMVEMEAYLWTVNDHRTHAATAKIMFKEDLRDFSENKIPMTLYNIITDKDQYFDNQKVKSTFLEIYDEYKTFSLNSHVHAPSLIADKEQVRQMISQETLDFLDS